MNRFDFYFRQKVTEGELDAAFDAVEEEFSLVKAFSGQGGIIDAQAVVQATPTPNLTVTVVGPLSAFDQTGNSVQFSGDQTVDMSQDENSASTAVATPGNEKWLGIFIRHERALSDPRIDGNGTPLFFNRADSFEIVVGQGAEAPIGTAVRPALRNDHLLIGDVRLINGQTQIQAADIDITRREWLFKSTQGSVSAGRLDEVVQQLADVVGTDAEALRLRLIDQNVGDNAEDGVTVVGADAISGSPDSLAQGTLRAMITELLGFANARVRKVGDTLTGTLGFNPASIDTPFFNDTNIVSGSDLRPVILGPSTFKLYVGNDIMYLVNGTVSWDGAQWIGDAGAGTGTATRVSFAQSVSSLRVDVWDSGINDWFRTLQLATLGPDSGQIELEAGPFSILNPATFVTPALDSLYGGAQGNIIKAKARIDLQLGSVDDEYNLDPSTLVIPNVVGGAVTIDYRNAFTNDENVVIATSSAPQTCLSANIVGSDRISIQGFDTLGGAFVNPDSSTETWQVIVV